MGQQRPTTELGFMDPSKASNSDLEEEEKLSAIAARIYTCSKQPQQVSGMDGGENSQRLVQG